MQFDTGSVYVDLGHYEQQLVHRVCITASDEIVTKGENDLHRVLLGESNPLLQMTCEDPILVIDNFPIDIGPGTVFDRIYHMLFLQTATACVVRRMPDGRNIVVRRRNGCTHLDIGDEFPEIGFD